MMPTPSSSLRQLCCISLLSSAFLCNAFTSPNNNAGKGSAARFLSTTGTNTQSISAHRIRIAHTKIFSQNNDNDDDDHWLDYLKFNGSTPSFDVVEKTKQYTSEPGYRSFSLKDIPTEYYSTDYIFRGPIVGPINRQDLVITNTAFGLGTAFPDLDREAFGFCVDPENPYRCLFFERWKATHTGELNLAGLKAEATGNKSISPVMPFSIVWTPDGEIIYEHLTTAVDRFEGNTMGKVAVFGLLETAGISLSNGVGDQILTLQQKLNRLTNSPAQIYSKAEDRPRWWKSQAVGAEKNDM